MARRSMKIPPKETASEPPSYVDKVDEVLNSLDSIQIKRKVAGSSNGNSSPAVKPTTIGMAIAIVAIAAILLMSFGSLPAPNTEGQVNLADLDFEIELLDSSSVMLSEYKGDQIILDLFATWCIPCKDQIVELQKLQAKHPNVRIISVSIEPEDNIPLLQTYSTTNEMDWIVGRDVTLKGASRFQVTSIPTMAFFNSQGILRHHESGVQSETVMSSWIIAN
ncbi:MAG: TlpA family protein disulfide reductase [Candidatus Hodarchaeales archaeon]